MLNQFTTRAVELLDHGIVAIPAFKATKRPAGRWQQFCERRPSEVELQSLFAQNADALCIITGRASGGAKDVGLLMLDFDQAGKSFADWKQKVDPAVFARLVIERTQHGGYHCFWRSSAATTKSEKFAMDEGGVLIESRCEHSVSICAPTPGYELLQGDFEHVPTLTPDEHNMLIAAARSFDARPAKVETSGGQGLTALPAVIPPDGDRPGDDYNRRGEGDFRRMLERHGWRYLGKSGDNENWQRPGKEGDGLSATWNGATLYVFSSNAQPLEANRGYSAFHAYALLEHGGDFSAAARALASQGYGTPRVAEDVHPYLSGQPSEDEVAEVRRERVKDPGLLPEKLCDVGGWIGELANFTISAAPRPNVRLAFAGALAAAAHVASIGRYADICDTRPNLYVLALGDSGSGKNAPRKTNKLLAAAIGEVGSVIDAFGSGQGLEDCFIDRRAILSNFDEFHKLLAALKDRDSALSQGIAAMLLQIFSESDQLHVFRRLAMSRPSDRNKRPASVAEPHLTLFATGIPALAFANLSTEAMTDGLMARCVLIEAGERGAAGTPHRAELPTRVVADAEQACRRGEIVDASAGPSGHGPTVMVDETDEARKLRNELCEEADRRYNSAPDSEQGAADRALYARQMEKTAKIALVLAISDNMKEPRIEAKHLRRAWDIVLHSTERMRFLASRYLFENDFDSLAKRAMRFVSESRKPITRSALLRSLHVDARSFDNLVATLIESRQIISVPGTRAGAVCYRPV